MKEIEKIEESNTHNFQNKKNENLTNSLENRSLCQIYNVKIDVSVTVHIHPIQDIVHYFNKTIQKHCQ